MHRPVRDFQGNSPHLFVKASSVFSRYEDIALLQPNSGRRAKGSPCEVSARDLVIRHARGNARAHVCAIA